MQFEGHVSFHNYCLVMMMMMMMMMMMILHVLPPLPLPLPRLQHPLPPVHCLCHYWPWMRLEDCHFLHMPPRWDSLMMADLTWQKWPVLWRLHLLDPPANDHQMIRTVHDANGEGVRIVTADPDHIQRSNNGPNTFRSKSVASCYTVGGSRFLSYCHSHSLCVGSLHFPKGVGSL